METASFDLLILGAGPAGLAAGIYGARSQLKVGVIDKGTPGGQIATTNEIENYPGFGQGTTGAEVVIALYNHAEQMGAKFIRDEIETLELSKKNKCLIGKSGQYSAEAVILAPGAEPRLLGIPGEAELRGKGVSYCATCDASFFKDLTVMVVGSGDAAIEEAIYLTQYAAKVIVVVLHDDGKVDANPAALARAQGNPKIEWIWHTAVEKINGKDKVESATLKDLNTGQTQEYPINGIFILIGTVPKTEILKGKIQMDSKGYIVTDERMQTSMEGVYACGDARIKYLRQVVTAVADGSVAAVAAARFLDETRSFEKEVLNAKEPVVLVGYYQPENKHSLQVLGELDQWAEASREQVKLVRVDASKNMLLSKRYQLNALPLIQVFRQGQLENTLVEKIDYADLEKAITKPAENLAAK